MIKQVKGVKWCKLASSNPNDLFEVTNDLFGSNIPTSMNSTNSPANIKYLNYLNKPMTQPTKIIQMAEMNGVDRMIKWSNSHNLHELLECVINTCIEEKTVNGGDYGQFEIYTAQSNVYGF